MSNQNTVSVREIESLLVCLPGVQKARVVINDWGAIEEIHILTGLGRNPKQIVRDVQSALKAKWDISVDRRKISIAQIRVGLPDPLGRLRYSGIEFRTNGETGKTDLAVTLERGTEGQSTTYVGKAQCDATETAILLGVAKATCLAANLALEPPHAFFVDDVTTLQIGMTQAVSVLVNLMTPRRNHEQMVGCALVRRDIREACVRATLDAMNRRMETIPQKGSVLRPGEDANAPGEPNGEPDVPDEPERPEKPGGESSHN